MKKTFLIATMVLVVTALVSFIQREEPKYTNLQVLPKDITHEQMDSIMHHFSRSLGVKCGFCHVKGSGENQRMDFASDKNDHKIAAREMFTMMRNLNIRYFGMDSNATRMPMISCYTCHRGKVNPENNPPKPELLRGDNPPPPPAAPGLNPFPSGNH